MKILILLILLTSGLANAAVIRDEELSQKYENLILDGEDKDVIEDMMTDEQVTPEDLELKEEMESEE